MSLPRDCTGNFERFGIHCREINLVRSLPYRQDAPFADLPGLSRSPRLFVCEGCPSERNVSFFIEVFISPLCRPLLGRFRD